MFLFCGKCGQVKTQQVFLFCVVVFAIWAETVADVKNNPRQVIARTTRSFADRFLKELAGENTGNLIASPLSAQIALAMVAYGADGTTASQIRSSLKIPSDNELGQSGYRSLIEALNGVQEVELRLANKIYIASEFQIKSTYKQLTASKFLSTSEEVNFNNAIAAATTINSWCEQQTNNRIKDVVKPDSLGSDTQMIVVNAVYFKGRWAEMFESGLTENKTFHLDAETTVNVPTMFVRHSFKTGDLPNIRARFIEIPYKGKEISMIIILPDEVDGLKRVQDNLHEGYLNSNLKRASSSRVRLYLPKFKIEATINLENILKKLGITDIFQNGADLSGMSDDPIKVSKIVQKTFIDVNEYGTEAAAITQYGIRLLSIIDVPNDFDVNRPFYFQIRYTNERLNVPLFTGLYKGPQ